MKIQVTKNTIQGSFWGIICKLTAIVLPFVIRTIIIRKLGAEYAGLNGLFSSILQILNLAELGIDSAMVFEMYKPVAEDDYSVLSSLLNFYRKAYLVIGSAVTIVGLSLIPFLRYLISGSVPSDINIYVLYLIYLFNSVSGYFFFAFYLSILFAYQRQADSSKIYFCIYLLTYVAQIIVLLVFKNYYLYVSFLPLATFLYNFIVSLFVKKRYPNIRPVGRISDENKKSIKKRVIALAVNKFGVLIPHTVDVIVISSFLGLFLVTKYDNYYYVLNSVVGIILILFNSLTAGLGNKLIKSTIQENTKDFSLIFSINGLIAIVCTTCLFSLYQDFIELWVGSEYLFSIQMVVLFCVNFYLHVIQKTVCVYRDASGMWKEVMAKTLVASILNLVLDIVLVRFFGVFGVIVPTILCMLFIDVPWEAHVLFKSKIKYPIFNYFARILFYAFITVMSCVVCNKIVYNLGIMNVVLKMLVTLALSLIISLGLFCAFTSFFEDNVSSLMAFFKERIPFLTKKK